MDKEQLAAMHGAVSEAHKRAGALENIIGETTHHLLMLAAMAGAAGMKGRGDSLPFDKDKMLVSAVTHLTKLEKSKDPLDNITFEVAVKEFWEANKEKLTQAALEAAERMEKRSEAKEGTASENPGFAAKERRTKSGSKDNVPMP